MIKRKNGFTPVEVLLVLLPIGILAGGGYFVWHKHHAAQATNKAGVALHASSTSAGAYSGSAVNLQLFSSGGGSQPLVSFVVPDGWVADKDGSDSLDFFADQLTYKPGTKFSYSTSANTRDIDRFMLSVLDPKDIPKEYQTYTKSDYGTVNGNKATLYYHKFSKGEHIGNVQMQGGETEHMYFITKADNAVMVSYYVLAGDQDQKQLIEQVVHTVQF